MQPRAAAFPRTVGPPLNSATPTAAQPAALAWIALGANLGDPAANVARALVALGATPGLSLEAASPIVRTEPVGPPQPRYANAVARVATTLAPEALLEALLAIEVTFFRRRAQRWGPRSLDLDLLLYGRDPGRVLRSPCLTLPHPELHRRLFVLEPLLSLDPDLRHPVSGRPLEAYREDLISPSTSPTGLL